MGTQKSILFNASNLHVGGGVQVAVSVLHELSKIVSHDQNVSALVSSEVDANLRAIDTDSSKFRAYRVLDVYGLKAIGTNARAILSLYDVVFTIFGPLYALTRPRVHIVGFAQPWIVYPENEIYNNVDWPVKVAMRLKYGIQRWFFRRSSHLVVELEHVKRELVRRLGITAQEVTVVHNAVSSIYADPAQWAEVEIGGRERGLRLGFVGRDYPHKNLSVLPEVRQILLENYGMHANFFVTLTDDEWRLKPAEFKHAVINVGPLSTNQCPSFYFQMDGIIFPSLLECFSATPLEAMVMRRPVFASDRAFVRDVCGTHAHYFEPTDPPSIAQSIHAYFSGPSVGRDQALEAAHTAATQMSSPIQRALSYLALCHRMAELTGTT